MNILRHARNCWGGYFFLLLIYWPFFILTDVAFSFPKVFTVIMSLGYFCGAYSLGWRGGRYDKQRHCASLKTAVLSGIFGNIISLSTLVVMIIGAVTGQKGGVFGIASDIFRFLHIHFLYLINDFGDKIIVHIIPVVLVLILYPLGYYFGVNGFSIIDKYLPFLLYKKKNQKDR